MPLTINSIDHIHIYVSNRSIAECWYQEVLGFSRIAELEFWASDNGPLTIANATGIHLALFERPAKPCHSTIAFAVSKDDFLKWQTHLSNYFGKKIEAVDHQLCWSLYFSDPDGNPYEIVSYDYKDLAASLV
jgi:catechol-2,3-dioxygenase